MAEEIQPQRVVKPEGKRLLGKWGINRNELGLVIAIVVIGLATLALDPQRNYYDHFSDSAAHVLKHTFKLGIFALGTTVVIIAGGIDLSCGAMIAFGGSICAGTMLLLDPLATQGLPSPETGIVPQLSWQIIAAGFAMTLLAGLLVGSLHAWLITVVGLPPFIATLASLVGLRSLSRALVQKITELQFGSYKNQISVQADTFRDFCKSIYFQFGLFLCLAFLVWLLLSRTVVGRHLYALGGNEEAAKLSGIRTDRLKWLAYCLGALTSALAGILYVAEQSEATPQSLGMGYELNSIAAAVIGGCSLQGGIGTISGTILGCLFLRTLIDGINKVVKSGADVYEGLIVGAVVAIAVAVNQFRGGSGQTRQFFPGILGAIVVVNLSLLCAALAWFFAGNQAALIVGPVAMIGLSVTKVVQGRAKLRERSVP